LRTNPIIPEFLGYDFDGDPLNWEVAAPNFEFHPDLAQVVGDAIYYRAVDKSIVRARRRFMPFCRTIA